MPCFFYSRYYTTCLKHSPTLWILFWRFWLFLGVSHSQVKVMISKRWQERIPSYAIPGILVDFWCPIWHLVIWESKFMAFISIVTTNSPVLLWASARQMRSRHGTVSNYDGLVEILVLNICSSDRKICSMYNHGIFTYARFQAMNMLSLRYKEIKMLAIKYKEIQKGSDSLPCKKTISLLIN